MRDGFGREIDYMRISITDRCNLRCRYCMPDGIPWIPMEEILTYEEITAVAGEAAKRGIQKIKVTGGEPLVRRGCPELVGMLKKVPGIKQVTLTTNGVLLSGYAKKLQENGLDAVNVSLDTLRPERFQEITGSDRLSEVFEGIDAALACGLPLKINTVLQSGKNEDEWMDLAGLAEDRKLDVRFIEMMPIGSGGQFEPVSNEDIFQRLKERFGDLSADEKKHGNGPAVYYRIPGFSGSVGFISAVHGKFCGSCNRIRMTSTGGIKPCLCFDEEISVREAVRSGNLGEVRRLLSLAVGKKPECHHFEDREQITERRKMSRIGG